MGLRKIIIGLSLFYQLEIITATGCYSKPDNEVCQTKREMPYMYSRGPETTVTEEMFDRVYCDVLAIDTGLWYYSMNNMTEYCPETYKCGTQFPIWLNGSSPKTADKIVNLTACLRDFDSCCLRTYSIAAVKCAETMAYCFNELPSGCHQRYCFDVKILPSTSTVTLTSTKSPAVPDKEYANKRYNDGQALIIASAVLLVAVLCILAVISVMFARLKRLGKVGDTCKVVQPSGSVHINQLVIEEVKVMPPKAIEYKEVCKMELN